MECSLKKHEKQKVLLLGGSGFIGKNLVGQLILNRYDVTVFSKNAKYNSYLKALTPQIKLVNGNIIEYDEQQIEELIENTDYIIHMISSTNPSNKDILYEFQSNVIPTIKLLNACIKCNIRKIIYLSSGGTVYGIPQYLPINEAHRTDPISAYGIHKLSEEKCFEYYGKMYGLNYTILRLANPFGIGQNPKSNQGAIAVFLAKVLTEEKIIIWGDGNQIRDYLYIEDVVNICIQMLSYDGNSKVFNIGSSKGYSLNQVLTTIESVSNIMPLVEYRSGRAQDVPANILDIALIKKELGWRPKIELEDGIYKMIQSWDADNYEFKIG